MQYEARDRRLRRRCRSRQYQNIANEYATMVACVRDLSIVKEDVATLIATL
jgi:hypothetical protein